MQKTITIIVKPEDENNEKLINKKAISMLSENNIFVSEDNLTLVFIKKSIDARHGKIKLCLQYKAYVNEKPCGENNIPIWKKANSNKTVIIIGSGPAGLFGALRLLESGITPIIIERGEEVNFRKKTIAQISTKNIIDCNSNYCFGEGGAGTFSDGKLYTRSNKRGDVPKILRIFNFFGASNSILKDAHPHIGTNCLPKIINSIRNKIIDCGGKFYFSSCCIDFVTEKINNKLQVKGVVIQNTKTKEQSTLLSDCVLLATGHSANDIYELISKYAKDALEAKTFAVGVRVEHKRKTIDNIQYHNNSNNFSAAEYKLTAQVDNRGVYSFCMCPGGFVVPSATMEDEIVVNGMSSAKRNSLWSNSAIVVETRDIDIPEEFKKKAIDESCISLAGLYWRKWLEKKAKINASKQGKVSSQAAPAQLLEDFLLHKKSSFLPLTSYTPGIVSSNLYEWLPYQIKNRLEKAFRYFNTLMKGFICEEALLIAIETRTSTPVRILRNKDTGECVSLANLFPVGEGSGYSGGIVSSAIDGENICAKIADRLLL